MIRKEEIKEHIVIPDSNILWFKDKTIVVNPDFDSFWEKYAQDSNLQLVIPEVVKGEILFQQSTSAIKQMGKASDCILEVSAITEYKYTHRMTAKRIRDQIEKRFDKWVKQKKAKIELSSISSIDWKELIQNSIWRKPPFELDAKNPDNEKGFRDAVILETIIEYVKSNSGDCFFAFICIDNMLRDTAAKKIKSDERFSAYKSIEDFESYLKLQHEELTDKFIKSILRKASLKFYNAKDIKCLAFRERLPDKIDEKYGKYLNDPKLSEDTQPLLGLLSSSQKWNPSVGGKYWVSNSQFVKIEKKTTYDWSTEVTYAKKFLREVKGLSDLATADNERVLLLKFEVTWTSKVFSDGRFRDAAIKEINMKENQFIALSSELKRTYSLE